LHVNKLPSIIKAIFLLLESARSQKIGVKILSYIAVGATTVAGALYAVLAADIVDANPLAGIFFVLAGAIHLFWVIPYGRGWGVRWYYAGMATTAFLAVMWAVLRAVNFYAEETIVPLTSLTTAIGALQAAFLFSTALLMTFKELRGIRHNRY
jgi:hypothetical protein